jgi:hypothetical protein
VKIPGGGRAARPARCSTCHAKILTGPDSDTCALPTRADPAPLTNLGEATAILGGRGTYLLSRKPPELEYREPGHIARKPADQYHVVAEHRCSAAPLPIRRIEKAPRNSAPIDPPF